MSSVSAISELSQEVSRYTSRQHPPTSNLPTSNPHGIVPPTFNPAARSASYQRLRQGIRGPRAAYPTIQQRGGGGGGAQRSGPGSGSSIPPPGSQSGSFPPPPAVGGGVGQGSYYQHQQGGARGAHWQ